MKEPVNLFAKKHLLEGLAALEGLEVKSYLGLELQTCFSLQSMRSIIHEFTTKKA